ncbi:MAG TPA: 2,3-bisphosphoglycerate-independent phosphoglycerate mutase, partial [Lysobacter sp.]|nr:2,3-bisphosphoglycerate-independent phosphoglycerate mutase [Lysobacter sp.]
MPSNPSPKPAAPKPIVLLILDGWGHREDPTDNALAQATLPNWHALLARNPHTLIHTEGRHVGLPDGQMGNSEVGHMNLGAGRIVYQDLTRIDAAIEDGSFFANLELRAACEAVKANHGTLHLLGLLSPGGVHSHENHIFAMIELARREGVPKVAVHAFLDGRDMPPRSAQPSLELLEAACAKAGNARIATVSGRYYAMDRDKRWDRQRRAWDAIVEGNAVDGSAAHVAPDALAALRDAYARGENDEFVVPTVIGTGAPVRDGDAIVFMNFRADRARQLTAAFVSPGFDGFEARRPRLSRFVCLTEYDARLPAPVAFAPDDLRNTLGEV